MNAALPRFLKSVYRREPISSFVITVGAVDAAIGGIGDRWSLFTFGLGTVGVAIALRWWQIQRHKTPQPERAPKYYLPTHSSRPQLPMLSTSPKRPPQ